MKKIRTTNVSIYNALLFTFVPLLLVSLIVILIIVRNSSQNTLYSVAKETMSRNLDWNEKYVESMVQPAQEVGNFLSHQLITDVSTLNDHELSVVMLERLRFARGIFSLYVGRPDGSFVLAGWRPRLMLEGATQWLYLKKIKFVSGQRYASEEWIDPEDPSNRIVRELKEDTYDPRTRPWYVKALEVRQESWTNPYLFFMTQKAGVTYSSPFVSKTGTLLWVVGVDLQLNTLAKFLAENRFSSNSYNFIFTDEKEVLAHPNLIDQLKIGEIPCLASMNDPVLTAGYDAYRCSPEYLSGEKFFTVVETPSGLYDIIFKRTNNTQGAQLIVGEHVPEADYLTPLQSAQRGALVAGGVMLFFVLGLGLYLARSLSFPIRELSQMANKVKEFDFETQLTSDSRIIEIHKTIESFNGMISSLHHNRKQNNELTEKLNHAHLDTLYRLALAAEYKDMDTSGHLDRVGGYSAVIADQIGVNADEIELLRHASIMHDVGKLSIPDSILLKKGKLNEHEWAVMKKHPVAGAKILENSRSEIMAAARVIALTHHEKWDGSGYPNKLSGNDIPLYGRIVAVADVFDALLTERSYKKAFTVDETIAIIREGSGGHFDPMCVQALEERIEDILEICDENTKGLC